MNKLSRLTPYKYGGFIETKIIFKEYDPQKTNYHEFSILISLISKPVIEYWMSFLYKIEYPKKIIPISKNIELYSGYQYETFNKDQCYEIIIWDELKSITINGMIFNKPNSASYYTNEDEFIHTEAFKWIKYSFTFDLINKFNQYYDNCFISEEFNKNKSILEDESENKTINKSKKQLRKIRL